MTRKGWPWPRQWAIDRAMSLMGVGASDEEVMAAAIALEEMSAVWDRLYCYELEDALGLNSPSVVNGVDQMLDGAVLCAFGRGRTADPAEVVQWYKRACLAFDRGALESGVSPIEDVPRPDDEFPVVWERVVRRCEAAGIPVER